MSLKSWYIFIACLISFGTPLSFQPALADDDGFDFMEDDSEYSDEGNGFLDSGDGAITYADSGTDNILAGENNLTLNDGFGVVNVGGFDIAGIMLGMSFDDVHNLYYDNASLYTPRKRNSLVYTIPQDWKYNLDYECR